MKKKRALIILVLVLIVVLSGGYFLWHKSKTPAKVALGVQTAAEPTATPDEGEIPHGKFYAPILLYHHIALKRPQNSYYVSPVIFDEQMKWLKDNDYHVISLDQFYEAAIGKEKIPSKPVVLTFDDGYQDQYDNALPILEKYSYPATFYVKINNINKGGMTWAELKNLQKAGHIIGSHSVNHKNMMDMPTDELKYELEESKYILELNLGTEIKHFCYPGGAYSTKTIEAVRDAGYLTATTTRHKVNQEIKNDNSLFTLPRVHIDDEMPTFIDWIQGKNLI